MKDEGVEKIIHDMIEDISQICTEMRDEHLDEYDNDVLMAAALQASLTFTVSTFIAAGIQEPQAHEVLNTYYSKLTPDINKIMKQARKEH